MIDLASHIEYLLMGHDCVVVPGLGAFLVHETAAYYDAEVGRLMPPVRSLGFNQALTINDGLLAESVARKRNVTLDAARVEVESAVASFRHQLVTAHSLPVGNLGILTEDDEALIFEPSQTSAMTMRYAGLRPLTVTPIEEEKPEPDEQIVIAAKREVTVPLSLKIAASVIILMVACGVFFATDSLMGKRQANYASLDSGLRSQVECPIAAADRESGLDISREIELNIAIPRSEAEASAVVELAEAPSLGRYLLVVGSFPSMKSAHKFIGDDSRMAVIEMDGKFRIYIASAVTNVEAHAKADILRDEFPSVWICRR